MPAASPSATARGPPPQVRGSRGPRECAAWAQVDHPRRCGAHLVLPGERPTVTGPPPQVRGSHFLTCVFLQPTAFLGSACGQRLAGWWAVEVILGAFSSLPIAAMVQYRWWGAVAPWICGLSTHPKELPLLAMSEDCCSRSHQEPAAVEQTWSRHQPGPAENGSERPDLGARVTCSCGV